MKIVLLLLVTLVAAVTATTYFKETFDGSWKSRWEESKWDKADGQEWTHTAGPFYGDAEADKGIQTARDAKFYAISAPLAKALSNAGKTLVLQFQVRFPQKIDCGGGYIKFMPSSVSAGDFNGDSTYNIMFGPDICGSSTKKVHVIFSHKGKNHLIKKEIRAEDDQLSHVYTLIVKPDDTYEVRVDGDKKQSGKLSEDWDFMAAKKIKDPSMSKPKDWVDNPKMDDPEDKKPANYDDIPKEIPDPEAKKPEDWDSEADGEWEAPQVPNPEFKGEWKPKKIDNPAYKGPWVHPEIDNPDYVEFTDLYKYDDFGRVGIDIWQVKAGTLFDNIIITDDVAEAEALMKETYTKNKDAEKKMFDAAEEAKRAQEEAERKKTEEASKANEGGDKKKDDAEDEDDDDDSDKLKDKMKSEL